MRERERDASTTFFTTNLTWQIITSCYWRVKKQFQWLVQIIISNNLTSRIYYENVINAALLKFKKKKKKEQDKKISQYF